MEKKKVIIAGALAAVVLLGGGFGTAVYQTNANASIQQVNTDASKAHQSVLGLYSDAKLTKLKENLKAENFNSVRKELKDLKKEKLTEKQKNNLTTIKKNVMQQHH